MPLSGISALHKWTTDPPWKRLYRSSVLTPLAVRLLAYSGAKATPARPIQLTRPLLIFVAKSAMLNKRCLCVHVPCALPADAGGTGNHGPWGR
jgi:hypothetical protein